MQCVTVSTFSHLFQYHSLFKSCSSVYNLFVCLFAIRFHQCKPAICAGSTESYLLDHQGRRFFLFFFYFGPKIHLYVGFLLFLCKCSDLTSCSERSSQKLVMPRNTHPDFLTHLHDLCHFQQGCDPANTPHPPIITLPCLLRHLQHPGIFLWSLTNTCSPGSVSQAHALLGGPF